MKYEIKALEWTIDRDWPKAETPIGDLEINPHGVYLHYPDSSAWTQHDSIPAAKAAAEEWYRSRLASALTPSLSCQHCEAMRKALEVAQLWLSNCVPTVDLPGPKPLPLIDAALASSPTASKPSEVAELREALKSARNLLINRSDEFALLMAAEADVAAGRLHDHEDVKREPIVVSGTTALLLERDHQIKQLKAELAAALAQSPGEGGDDEEPLTVDWAESIGARVGKSRQIAAFEIKCLDRYLDVLVEDRHPVKLLIIDKDEKRQEWFTLWECKTRGRVRLLCKALGIPLNESAKGNEGQ